MDKNKMTDRYTLSDYEYNDLFGGIEKVNIDPVIIPEEGKEVKPNKGKYSGPINLSIPKNKKLEEYPLLIRETINFLNDQGNKGFTFERMIENYIEENSSGSTNTNVLTNAIYRMLNQEVLTLNSLDDILHSLGYLLKFDYIKEKELENNIIPEKSSGKYSGTLYIELTEDQRNTLSPHIVSFIDFINYVGENDGYTFETLIDKAESIHGEKSRSIIGNTFYRMTANNVFSYNSLEEISGLLGYKVTPKFELDKSKYINEHSIEIDREHEFK